MIIIYTFDRRYINIEKVSFCSQYSFVSAQYSFISQRIFHNSHNSTRLNQSIESLSWNRKETARSALIHKQWLCNGCACLCNLAVQSGKKRSKKYYYKTSEEVDTFLAFYVFWSVLWHLASSDQILPRFSGWCINMQSNLESLK